LVTLLAPSPMSATTFPGWGALFLEGENIGENLAGMLIIVSR